MTDDTIGFQRVMAARAAMTALFLPQNAIGIEVGAGSRPFPVPDHITVNYGDIRDKDALGVYFAGLSTVGGERTLDAQTLAGVLPESLDFVISGHVIEHLEDPIGCVVSTMRVLRDRGFFIIAVPDMRLTFDRTRVPTTVAHVLTDYGDGGVSTRHQAFLEHLTFVHPLMSGQALTDSDIAWQAAESLKRHKDFDLHYHAWPMDGFRAMLEAARRFAKFTIETAIPIENENIFVLKKGS